METRWKRLLGIVLSALVATAFVAGCGSDDGGSDDSGSGGSGVPASLVKEVEGFETEPTEIVPQQIGLKEFTPKEGGTIYNISCDVSIVGCNAISNNIKSGVEAIGYDYTRCDATSRPDGANRCFTQAVNAKPDVIIINAVGVPVAADGYAEAEAADIPVVGLFTGDKAGAGGTDVQVGLDGCLEQGQMVAKAVAVRSDGAANALFVTEESLGCDVARFQGWNDTFPEACPDCEASDMKFDAAQLDQALPQQIQAELNSSPDLNWIVGVFDGVAAVANTQVEQAGKADQIQVAGMDGDPANIEVMRNGGVQTLDVAFAFVETPWAAADAAARIFSGEDVPEGYPANKFLITQDNLNVLPESGTWEGPPDFKDKYLALWNKG